MAQVADTIISRARVPQKKGAARRLRAEGWVPAVAYGPGTDNRHLAVEARSFLPARLAHGVAHIYDVQIEGEDGFKALIKSVERDPVDRKLLHIDLFAVDMTQPIRVAVRVELTGKAAGEIDGGMVQQILRRVEVQCLPADIPDKLTVAVDPMNVGDTLHISDLDLPEGVKSTSVGDEAVVIVAAPEAEEEVAAPAEGELVATEGEEAAAADDAADGDSEKKE